MNNVWNVLPEPLRRLLGLPAVYHSPVKYPGEWPLYRLAVHQLHLKMPMAYRLMDAGSLPRRFRYRHFTIPKKNGSVREIVEPGPDLKIIQRKILKLYLKKAKPHASALGFRPKKSIADHAWAHAGAATIITADIEDFFPSTTRQRVKGWWHSQGLSTLEVRLLTSLTTYRGSLPQGAPTSPPLSNLVNAELDAAIERRVRLSGGTYTRYADDLAFSWPDGYSPPADFENAIRALLREAGYRLHPDKGWHIWRRQDQPEVTGLTLTKRGTVEIPESMQRIIRVLQASDNEADQKRLAGYEGYRSMVALKSK
ncbi:MAG: reverse transcriptase family protein [Chloroflexota bacterium]